MKSNSITGNISYRLLGHIRDNNFNKEIQEKADLRGVSHREIYLEEHNDHLCRQTRHMESEWCEMAQLVDKLKLKIDELEARYDSNN